MREQGDLGRAPGERRILRVASGLVIRPGGERRLAALKRDLADKDPVHDLRAISGRGCGRLGVRSVLRASRERGCGQDEH